MSGTKLLDTLRRNQAAAERGERVATSFRSHMGIASAPSSAGSKKTKKVETETLSEDEAEKIIRKLRKKAEKHASLDARLTAIENAQVERTARTLASVDRAEVQATTERKLRLVPGAIHRQDRSDRKASKVAEVTSAVFDGVMPSVLRALRMGGLSDVQIAAIVLSQKCG